MHRSDDAPHQADMGQGGLAIETSGLTKRFGARTAIDSVALQVPRASAFGFLGPNGAGKTTMIRMLLGLTRASAGEMRLLGRPVPQERAAALSRVGAIVEEPRFHSHLTGRENLRIIAAARGEQARALIEPSLARVGLADRAGEKVKKYSLGMRQRLGVARCLLADPLLLMLDEPTNGLDPGGIQEFRLMIRELVEQEGRTIFLSSHLLDEVEKICDHAAIVDSGKVVMQGAIAELAHGGAHGELIVSVDDPERAMAVLEGHACVQEARRSDEGLRVVLSGDPELAAPVGAAQMGAAQMNATQMNATQMNATQMNAAQVNAALVSAGLAVSRLEPVRQTLEQRFLQITSRLGADPREADGRVAPEVQA